MCLLTARLLAKGLGLGTTKAAGIDEEACGWRKKTTSFLVRPRSFLILRLASKVEVGKAHLLDMVVVHVGVHGVEYVASSGSLSIRDLGRKVESRARVEAAEEEGEEEAARVGGEPPRWGFKEGGKEEGCGAGGGAVTLVACSRTGGRRQEEEKRSWAGLG